MTKQNDVNKVRNAVMSQTGKKVKVRINRGRHKVDVTEGVISETYPSIFLIKIQEGEDMPVRTMSYSYTDILTRDVELILCS
ncbi:MAG TPA: Veg family protein [Mobilitalea sp.]|nr:Veg family protein [Mobilitalea sp.]